MSDTACRAVTPEIGTAAACSKVHAAGLATSRSTPATARSAKAPVGAVPSTSSPATSSVTPSPTAATTPASSRPSTGCFGRRTPKASRISRGSPCITCHAPRSTPAALTSSSTSPAPGTGSGRSSSRTCSVPPYSVRTIACMVPPLPYAVR